MDSKHNNNHSKKVDTVDNADKKTKKDPSSSLSNNMLSKQLEGYVTDKLDSIHSTPINIALTGDTGSGKSTLINTLRGLRPNDKGAAKVGTVETTLKPVPYEHPNFPNVIFWDLPGVGTPNFPQKTYKKKVNLKFYDFFLIVISNRFTENALWLAKVLTKKHRPFFFVRSKVDIDISMKRKYNPNIKDKQILKELKSDIKNNLSDMQYEVFIVSGELDNTDRWDFPELKRRIIGVLPDVKKQTLIVSLSSFATDIIDQKCEVLKNRIIFYSIASGFGALVPVPGLSFGVDTALLVKMAVEMAQVLGLTENQVGTSYEKLSRKATVIAILGKATALISTKAILKLITKQASSAVVEEVVRYVPVAGQLAAGALSFGATYQTGRVILKKMRELALQMADEIVENQSKDIEILDFSATETEQIPNQQNSEEDQENSEYKFDTNKYIETEL
jgi:predicted GTPase